MGKQVCSCCGRDLGDVVRDWRCTLPEPVLSLPEREYTAGTWMSDDNARVSELLQVPNCGCFVRAIVPIAVTDGRPLTWCVWLFVHPNDFRSIVEAWWGSGYAGLTIEGWLANSIPPWDLLAAPVRAAVARPDQLPRCVDSQDPRMASLLRETWSHTAIFGAAAQP
ncbi:DUF2199 domain-containing protein [Nocardia gipuzkoensis]